VLSSWDDAIRHCSSLEWENLCLEAVNQYRERLFERARERFNKWNDIVDEVAKTVDPLVSEKIADVVKRELLPDIFKHRVRLDILNVCMEAEYADIYPPGFYASQAYWYTKGHFPCGWKGDFATGCPIVY
jgi:hypothetical protein